MPSVLAAYAAFGLIVGLGYFVSLRHNVDLYIDRGPDWLPMLMHGLRIAAAIAIFAWLASLGALPILSSFAGFLAGRMVTLIAAGWLVNRRIALAPGRLQAAVELVVAGIAREISDTLGRPAEPFLPFLGTLFLFLVAANLAPLLPGVHAPTARLETTAALALVVFVAAHVYGVRTVGVRRHLARYLKPTPLLLPLNVLSELTRTFSLAVRLFGNIMSHELMLGLVLAIAGLLVPVPLMVLGIIIGLVQAYIFTVLATIYLGAAIGAFEVH